MFRSTPHLNTQPFAGGSLLRRFLWLAAVYVLCLAVAASLAMGSAVMSVAVFAVAVTVAGHGLAQSYPHAVLGYCNAVTLARVAIVAFLAGAVAEPEATSWLVFAVACLAFALDGVDGWLARRAGLVSDFGARFDMETDALLAAMLSLWLWTRGITGPEILVLGFMRYAFVFASLIWPALQAPLPEALRRKAICVVQIGALILLTFPLTPIALAMPVATIAALLLTWSFAIDIIWLVRRSA